MLRVSRLNGTERGSYSQDTVAKKLATYRRLAQSQRPRVLRVYQSAVVTEWRERDRQLRRRGFEVTTVTPRRGVEGGADVELEQGSDSFLVPARTFGHHPMLLVYDPVPIWRAMRAHRFDAVDIHHEPASLAAAELLLLRSWLARRSRVLLYSAQNVYKRYPWPFRWFERRALDQVNGVYACNPEAAEVMRRKGCKGIVRVIPLGVDLQRFSPDGPAPSRVEDTRCLRVGFVGRLDEQKGVPVLLEAVASREDCSLEVVGDGPSRKSLETRAQNLGLGGRVRFRGSVRHDQLPDFYRALDVLVVPSLPTSNVLEQFSRVAVEAMACAVPVVASEVGTLPSIVGDHGVLVPPGDPEALARALARLAGDPAERRRLGGSARQWSRRYSWAAVADAHASLYVEAGV